MASPQYSGVYPGLANEILVPFHNYLSSTYNAADFLPLAISQGNGSKENAIQLAINQAAVAGIKYVYVPANMLPYNASLVTFNNAVQMLCEGGEPTAFDVRAYGAQATTASDQTVAIQAAIDAQHNAGKGYVYAPAGNYAITGLTYYSGSQIVGQGFVGPLNAPGTMFVQASATAIMLQPKTPSSITTAFRFVNFGISSFGNTNNLGALDCTNCSDFVVEDVLVNGAAVFGVRVVGGPTPGNAGFAHFTRVIVNNHQSGAYAWLISSSAQGDQPDGLTFTDCRTNSQFGTWIKYQSISGNHGAGSNVWKGCTFEAQGGNAVADLTVDAAGAGPNLFVGCRFENTGTGGVQVTLNGFGIQPFAWFVGCNWAPGSGGFTFVDNGPVLSRRFADLNGTTNGLLFQVTGQQTALRTVTANTTLTQNDHTVLVDATSGNLTITLPNPSAAVGATVLRIKKVDSSANTVTINPAGLNIDGGGASLVLASQNQGFELQTDNTNWFVTDAYGISYTAAMQLKAFTALSWGAPNQNYLQIDGTPKFIWALGGTNQLTMTTSDLAPTNAGGKTLGATQPFGWINNNAATNDGSVALVSGTTPAVNARAGNYQTLTVLTNIAVVIAVPTNPPAAGQSQDLFITIRNGSGGALTTAPTFNTGAGGFKFSAGSIVNMANGTQVVYHWRWDNAQSFYYLVTASLAL